jgi:hypothetical protein
MAVGSTHCYYRASSLRQQHSFVFRWGKGCNCCNWRHQGVWKAEVQLHTFLASALEGNEWSASQPSRFKLQRKFLHYPLIKNLGRPQCRLESFRETNICCPYREMNTIRRPVPMSEMKIWDQNENRECLNCCRHKMLSFIIAATLIAATDAQACNYSSICANHTMCLYPTPVRI